MITGERGIWRDARRFATLRDPFGAYLMATKMKRAKKRAAKRPRAKATAKARPGARRQPETLRLRQITPSFTATDLQRSIAFYRDVLGFVIGEEWRGGGGRARGGGIARSGGVMPGLKEFATRRPRPKGPRPRGGGRAPPGP